VGIGHDRLGQPLAKVGKSRQGDSASDETERRLLFLDSGQQRLGELGRGSERALPLAYALSLPVSQDKPPGRTPTVLCTRPDWASYAADAIAQAEEKLAERQQQIDAHRTCRPRSHSTR
jgi:hypothetical protein